MVSILIATNIIMNKEDNVMSKIHIKLHRSNGKVKFYIKKTIHVGKDQEKAQSEKDSHPKNRGGKKPN